MRNYSIQAQMVKKNLSDTLWEDPSPCWPGRGKPKYMQTDFETYSETDISNCGSYRYIDDDTFEPLLLAAAFDDKEPFMIDLACGEDIPDCVWAAIFDPEITKTAWNAQFERTIFGKMAGETLSPDSWKCTMVWSASLSLPLALKTAAQVLKTGEQKDSAGEALIRYFSIPCKPTKANGGRTRNLPEHNPEGWRKFKEYCLQDVRTERDIRKRLESFPLPDHEWDYYHLDQRVNDRGVRIDLALVEQAITCDLMQSEIMTKKAYELTGLENPNSVSQLKGWLEERGIPIESLGKKDVAALIEDLDKHSTDAEALEMMKLRLQMAKSSVKKYQAAQRCVCADGRARGLFQFSGANRTQRWSGRLIQLQNLYRNDISTLDEARELVRMGCFDMVESIYGNTPDVLSQLTRTMLVPKEGCEFVIADFSAIEARVLAWLAGEDWVLQAFREGKDLYCATASQMFGVPVVKHGVNSDLRQKGKIATLACIAEGQVVLTDYGLVPIEEVTIDMKVWDGEEWVSHDGVVFRGEREVITYEGLTATPDHLVWVEGQSEPVQFGIAAACSAHLVQTGDGGRAVRLGENYQSRETLGQNVASLLCSNAMPGVRINPMDTFGKPEERTIQGMSELHTASADTTVAGQKTDSGETTMRESEGSELSSVRCQRNKVRLSECDGSRTLLDSEVWNSRQENGAGSDRQQWELRSGEYPLCDTDGKQRKSEEHSAKSVRTGILALCQKCCNSETFTGDEPRRDHRGCGNGCIREEKELASDKRTARLYDIRNAGRHHRFTVSGRLVHNCGYGGSTGALISMGALSMGLKEDELPEIIDSWRTANPNIVQFWWDVEKAAVETVKDHQERQVRMIRLQFYANTLWLVLPSGRKLAYIKPKLQPNRFGRMAITYEGLGQNNKWARGETYSGRLVENITQSTARDLLAEAMWRLEQAGYDIVAHVHDEVILEAPKGSTTVDAVCGIMNQNPSWAEELPLSSAGYVGEKFYFKD